LLAARSHGHGPRLLNPFLIAFGSGFHGLFAGLVPIAGSAGELAGIEAGKPSARAPQIPRLVKKIASPFVHPMTFVPASTPWRIGFFLGVLLVAGIALMASSLLPSRVIRWTAVPVNDFIAARTYVAVLGASILVAVALAYALGALRL
jgi:hypothetical protein